MFHKHPLTSITYIFNLRSVVNIIFTSASTVLRVLEASIRVRGTFSHSASMQYPSVHGVRFHD